MAKVLIVDDEVGIREVIRDALLKEGYEVTTVPSAEQALATLFQKPFDLAVLDLDVAGSSGLDVLKKIRELQKDIPVVIYSGSVTAQVEQEAIEAGANKVLSKDVGLAELVQELGSLVKTEEPAQAAAEGDAGAGSAPVLLEKSILIVDDEAEIRSVLTEFFTKKEYKTEEAENGKVAVEKAKAGNFSFVLCDIDMPEMDGLATLEELLKLDPKPCVIMVTGRQDDDKVKKALELGAYNYVLKPFEFLYLELVIKSKLESAGSA